MGTGSNDIILSTPLRTGIGTFGGTLKDTTAQSWFPKSWRAAAWTAVKSTA